MSTALQPVHTLAPGANLEAYIQSVSAIPILSAEEERVLADRLYYHEDLEAARQLVMSHLRFVVHIARSYSGYGLAQADLVQEGNVGLMKAVKRFNPEMGVRLVSFAVHWIRAEIHEFILRNWRIVKVATTKAQRKLFFNLRSQKKKLAWLTHDELNAVAEELGVEPRVVRAAYLALETSESAARELVAELRADSRVAEVDLIDRDQALAEFRASSGLTDALDFLDENPLPHTLLITPEERSRSAAGVQTLVTYVEGLPGVERVQVDLGWLQRLNAITELLTRATWALAVLLGAAVVLVIGNTVRLAIENRRDEIVVAKLVGGTDAFVRRPFLYTGAWYGLGGGLVAWVLLQVSLWWLGGPVERLAGLYQSRFTLAGLGIDGGLALIIMAMVLGWLGAWVAVKRHLDDIEPGDTAGG